MITRTFLLLALSAIGFAQIVPFEPEGAQVFLYFPHLADGGPPTQQWQTEFIFVNPSTTTAAFVELDTWNNNGSPLSLDLGFGLNKSVTFSIPASGSRTLRSRIASSSIVTGWAVATSTVPLQATVLFTLLQNGVGQLQIAAPATLPSPLYWSPANSNLGIAVANPSNGTVNMVLQAMDSQGVEVSQATLSLGAFKHTSFNASPTLPNLPSNFNGTLKISGAGASDYFLAWTLNADAGVLSSLPPGRAEWPISQNEQIWKVWQRVLDAANNNLSAIAPGINLLASPSVHLAISSDNIINAFASPDGTVQINLALSELVSDSPSELAFAVAHELGHIVQFKLGGRRLFNANVEKDADFYGMLFSVLAGFDPYAAAGTLAKIDMAYGQVGLVAQAFDNISGDVHGSFNDRLALIFQNMVQICAIPQYAGFCQTYKRAIHPHLPPTAPLSNLPAVVRN